MRIAFWRLNPEYGELTMEHQESILPVPQCLEQTLRESILPKAHRDDAAEFRTMQEKELSHGRLGMIAAAGFLAQEAVTGQTWAAEDSIFETLVVGGWFDKAAIDLASTNGL